MYRAFYKETIDNFLGEQFKKSHENPKKIIFQPQVSDLDQKKYFLLLFLIYYFLLNFLITILP